MALTALVMHSNAIKPSKPSFTTTVKEHGITAPPPFCCGAGHGGKLWYGSPVCSLFQKVESSLYESVKKISRSQFAVEITT